MPIVPSPPHCLETPPWTACGDLAGPDFGRVFLRPAANGAAALFFDRTGRRHAATFFDGGSVGAETILFGRRFSVVRA